MPSPELLQRAKQVLLADVNYGHRFADALCLSEEDAAQRLQPGDLLIHYVPQLERNHPRYEELLVRGCMHIAIVAAFGAGPLYKIESIQIGPICTRNMFENSTQRESDLRRYHLILRFKRIRSDPALQRQLNESILKFSGFEVRDDEPVRIREVHGSAFLETHRLTGRSIKALPKSLYCSELAYLAYEENGIEVCPLVPLRALIASIAPPDKACVRRMANVYALGSRLVALAYIALIDLERLMMSLKIEMLRPSKFICRHAVWPHCIFENPEFDLVAVVPPTRRHIQHYEEVLREVAASAC
jgi:hypothetical protein